MAWTQDDLTALDQSIALGAKRVKFENRETEFRSLEEMMRLRDTIKGELDATAPATGPILTEYQSDY